MWPWLVEAAGKVLYGTIASRAGRCVWLRLVEAVWNVQACVIWPSLSHMASNCVGLLPLCNPPACKAFLTLEMPSPTAINMFLCHLFVYSHHMRTLPCPMVTPIPVLAYWTTATLLHRFP